MARESGAFSVLVLSGSTRESDLEHAGPAHQPDLVVPFIGSLLQHL